MPDGQILESKHSWIIKCSEEMWENLKKITLRYKTLFQAWQKPTESRKGKVNKYACTIFKPL